MLKEVHVSIDGDINKTMLSISIADLASVFRTRACIHQNLCTLTKDISVIESFHFNFPFHIYF